MNPTIGVRLPAVRGKRDRVASPKESADLIAAVPEADRPIWATAFYGGLRLGELRALEWESVDLPGGVIHVTRSWDHTENRPIARAVQLALFDLAVLEARARDGECVTRDLKTALKTLEDAEALTRPRPVPKPPNEQNGTATEPNGTPDWVHQLDADNGDNPLAATR